jgi:hypothetical protein
VSVPWLSVVIPTSGRRPGGLLRTLCSIREQQGTPDVEVLVVADTYGQNFDDMRFQLLRQDVEAFRLKAKWLEHNGGVNCYGQPQRSFGARAAQGEWVAFSQDDNILTAGAVDTIWLALVQEKRKRPLFFRVMTPWRETVWRTPHLVIANIDADCLVLPREIAREVVWGLRYEGDFDAAEHAYKLAEGDVGWRDEMIAIARPDQEHVWW